MKWSYLTPVFIVTSWPWFVKSFFQICKLHLWQFSALWVTRLHSTLFERSDSYPLGISSNIGMAVLNLIGRRANEPPLTFLGAPASSAGAPLILWIFRRRREEGGGGEISFLSMFASSFGFLRNLFNSFWFFWNLFGSFGTFMILLKSFCSFGILLILLEFFGIF